MIQLEPERFQFTSADGLRIACVRWSGHQPVRGVVQIAHGLGEHIGRYAELAATLTRGHFVVYGNDHRGHGISETVWRFWRHRTRRGMDTALLGVSASSDLIGYDHTANGSARHAGCSCRLSAASAPALRRRLVSFGLLAVASICSMLTQNLSISDSTLFDLRVATLSY